MSCFIGCFESIGSYISFLNRQSLNVPSDMSLTPPDLVIVNEYPRQSDSNNNNEPFDDIPLPAPEDFSFSNVVQYCLKESDLVEKDINAIFSKLSDTIDDQISHITVNQNDISSKMTRIDKLASNTLRKTSSQISSIHSISKKLSRKTEDLSVETDNLYELLTSVTSQIQEIESKLLSERERIGSLYSDHAIQYPRLHKYLISRQTPRPLTISRTDSSITVSRTNSNTTSTAPIAPIASNRSGPRHSVSSVSLSTLRNSSEPNSSREAAISPGYRSPSLSLQSVSPVMQQSEDLPQVEHDSMSLISQITAVPRSFSMKSLANWARPRSEDRIETAQERLRKMLGENR